MSEITRILSALQQGDPRAADELLPLIYAELRRLAAAKMAREQPGHTLQATALVHEAYIRLLGGRTMTFNDRKHFFAAAGLAMRRILVERARRVAGPEAGGDRVRVELDVRLGEAEEQEEPDWAALDEAMTVLTAEDPELAEVVHLRYYAGLNVNEVAEALETSPRTVDRRWQVARAWLLEFLTHKGGDPRF